METLTVQEIETKKRFLKRYKKNNELIDRLEDKRDLLDDKITSIRSPKLSSMPRGGKPITIEDLIGDKEELEERIARLKVKGKRLKSEILAEIDTLEDVRYAEILESYFIDCCNIEDIAENKGYTVRHVYRLYSEAIAYLTEKNH